METKDTCLSSPYIIYVCNYYLAITFITLPSAFFMMLMPFCIEGMRMPLRLKIPL